MTVYYLTGINLITVSIVVFFVGYFLANKIKLLKEYHIPEGVIGGILCSLFFYICQSLWDVRIEIDTELRNLFLLVFFCTVGMGARMNIIIDGGKRLFKLMFLMFLFLILQNTVGLSSAILLGSNPLDGLIAGSISLLGGHGTAISWGNFFEQEGYAGATELGMIAATIGLLLGGMVGGPVVSRIIKKYHLRGGKKEKKETDDEHYEHNLEAVTLPASLYTILKDSLFVFCRVIVGSHLHSYLAGLGMVIPVYLPVLLVGMIFINAVDNPFYHTKLNVSTRIIDLFNDVSLQIFITMSMMGIEIGYLLDSRVLSMAAIIFVQVVAIILFARYIFFFVAGKDYDAAVITSGFIGAGLGATPIGLANAATICRRFGASPKALLLIPFIGSVFTDVLNALTLQGFLMLPFLSPG